MYLNFKNLILVISALFMSHTIAAPIETQIDGEDVKVYTGFKKIGEIGNIDSSINNNEVNIEVKGQTLKDESLQSTNDFSDSIENDNSNIVVVGNTVYQEDLKPSLHHIALVKSKNSSYLLGKTIIVECNDDTSNCLNIDLAIEQVLKLDDHMYLLKVKDFNEWQNVMGYLKSNSGIKTISPFYDKQISAKVY